MNLMVRLPVALFVAALAFLPPAELPADMAWAAEVPSIAGAFARFAAAVEAPAGY